MASANPLMWLFMLCLTTSCSTPPTLDRPSPQTTVAAATDQKSSVSTEVAKIASPIRRVIQQMQVEGRAPETASYSNALVRVDDAGRIQTDIAVTHIDPQIVAQLRSAHVEIDQMAEYSIIQGWIPFDRVEQVAALSFVREIRPPRYAIRR